MSYLQLINPGNSGCKIKLIFKENKPLIQKEVTDKAYAFRLERQKLKQIQYASVVPSTIIVPKVIGYGKGWFRMEYIPMVDSIVFFERSTPHSILERVQYLLDFINNNLIASKEKKLDSEVIRHKINEIQKKVKKSLWRKYYSPFETRLNKKLQKAIVIPMGPNHGDLSLSNVLFSLDTEKICFIDFLDNFIETPLLDIIKLRQDTLSFWTDTNYPKSHDNTKIRIINRYLNTLISHQFKKQINSEGFKVLEILNYLRLAPYAKSLSTHQYIADSLEKITVLG